MKRFALVVLPLVFCFTTGYVQARYEIDSLLHALHNTKPGEQHIDLLNSLALSYTLVSISEAEKYATQAIGNSRELNYRTGLAEGFKILGSTYYVKGEHDKAIEYCYESLKLYEASEDKSGQSDVLNNLAIIFTTRHELDKAYDLSIKSLKLKREIGDSVGVATSILARAEIFMQKNQVDKALELGKDALARYRFLKNNWGISRAMLQLGKMYHKSNNFPYASGYYYETIRTAAKANDDIQAIAAYKQLGKIYLEASRFDSSYYYLHRALSLARSKNSKNNEMEIGEILANYFSALEELDSSLYYTKTSGLIEREIFDSQKSQQISTTQMLYEFEKKEQTLSLKEEQIRRQNFAIICVTLILVLVTIFGFKLYGLNKNNKSARDALQMLNKRINKLNANLEERVQERTEEIRFQNQKLVEYAFFTAHEVRGPLARILGLVELVKVKELNHEREEILSRLQIAANELDEIITQVNRKLEVEHKK